MVNLGFTFQEYKNGDIIIKHKGRIATTLRGIRTSEFKESLLSSSFDDSQELMVRLTGNYKHGNEKVASAVAAAV